MIKLDRKKYNQMRYVVEKTQYNRNFFGGRFDYSTGNVGRIEISMGSPVYSADGKTSAFGKGRGDQGCGGVLMNRSGGCFQRRRATAVGFQKPAKWLGIVSNNLTFHKKKSFVQVLLFEMYCILVLCLKCSMGCCNFVSSYFSVPFLTPAIKYF